MEPQGAGRLIPGQKSVCLVFSAVGGEPLLAERDSHGRALLPSSSTLPALPSLPTLPTLSSLPTLLSPGRHIVQLAPAGGARHPQGPDFSPETVAESIIGASPPLSEPISRASCVLIVNTLLGQFFQSYLLSNFRWFSS